MKLKSHKDVRIICPQKVILGKMLEKCTKLNSHVEIDFGYETGREINVAYDKKQ